MDKGKVQREWKRKMILMFSLWNRMSFEEKVEELERDTSAKRNVLSNRTVVG
jgi:hypothetical protein